MKALLLAYEYPPSASPQSLRWERLVAALSSSQGVEFRVLAPGLSLVAGGVESQCDRVQVVRAFPGWFQGTVGSLRALRARITRRAPAANPEVRTELAESGPIPASVPVVLNWKGRLVELLQAAVGASAFPDIRAGWNGPARRLLRDQLKEFQPDVVIASHEPASVLYLGLEAKLAGYPWIADLGDPVLASYTPARWRRRAFRLEARVCREADHVVVTTEATRRLLIERHALDPQRISVITQGFDLPVPGPAGRASRQDGGAVRTGGRVRPLTLVYTGSFYPFRSPEALVGAVLGVEGVQLVIASHTAHPAVVAGSRSAPDRIRFLGALQTPAAHRLQQRADVLVDLGNEDPVQVPGKLYEYLGAGRPILHIGTGEGAGAGLVQSLSRGWVCANDPDAIRSRLARLAARHRDGTLREGLRLNQEEVAEFSWQRGAERMLALMEGVIARPGGLKMPIGKFETLQREPRSKESNEQG